MTRDEVGRRSGWRSRWRIEDIVTVLILDLLLPDRDSTPTLLYETESLAHPWDNVALICYTMMSGNIQLLKDGKVYRGLHLKAQVNEPRFLLGNVTEATRGIYRCRLHQGNSNDWSALSKPVDLTRRGILPLPTLSAEPAPWVTPGLMTKLHCQGPLKQVSFVLRKNEDQNFVMRYTSTSFTGIFHILQPGSYSCSYEITPWGFRSEPSQMVTVQKLDFFPAPTLERLTANMILKPGSDVHLRCATPMPDATPSLQSMGDWYTCRYSLNNQYSVWSRDSDPVEILVNDESLPKPTLSLASKGLNLTMGSDLVLRCQGPLAGVTFVLLKETSQRPLQVVSSAGHRVDFQIPDFGVHMSGKYSCLYLATRNGSSGSEPSDHLELQVKGLMPKPLLWSVWRNTVAPGSDATLHCLSPLPDMHFHLLRAGQVLLSAQFTLSRRIAQFILTNVQLQDAGNYSCRYYLPHRDSLVRSEDSDPMELRVEKESY
ncbi:PREDICTED: alpha-1B-glycoprotein-like [Elephantulus edwardii]|uniref:alpha-1B-glycoprotein-like n=1 Tax=Elephantulus edwardii TaxID=28737 RepID=UPI0003F0B164|nr:PREDICTED: alpha-1B-glycoprotein-like [Elephantulus edwardii]